MGFVFIFVDSGSQGRFDGKITFEEKRKLIDYQSKAMVDGIFEYVIEEFVIGSENETRKRESGGENLRYAFEVREGGCFFAFEKTTGIL